MSRSKLFFDILAHDKTKQAFDAVEKRLSSTQQKVQAFGRGMQVAGAAVSAVGAGVALAVRGQLNAADELGKTAQQLGLPVEALSQLQYAADLSGVSMSSLETGMRRFSQNMAQDADKFEALGVSVRDLDGAMRPTMDVMEDVAQVLASMPDGAEKTALAMDLMGRSGAEMIPLLNGGRDALREMMEEADRLGLTISGETAAAAAAFNDNLTRLGGQMGGLTRIVSAELAPVLERISDVIVSVAQRFQGMSPEMRRFSSIAAGLTVVLGPVLVALGLMVSALAAISLPVLAVIAGVAALTAGIVAFWPQIVAAKDALVDLVREGVEAAKEAFEDAMQAVSDFTDRMIDLGNRGVEFVKEKLRELVAFLADLPRQFREAGANLMSGLVDGVQERWNSARSTLGGIWSSVTDNARSAFRNQSPSRVFMGIGGDLMDGLAIGIRDNSDKPIAAIGDLAAGIDGPLKDAASSLSDSIRSGLEGIILHGRSATDVLRGLASQLQNSLFQSGMSMLGQAFGGPGTFLGSLFGGFRADGGPVSAGRSYIVGERGPELFTPRASGQITSNEAMRSGGEPAQVVVRILPSGEFDARVENSARAVVRVERGGIVSEAVSATYRAADEVPIGVR